MTNIKINKKAYFLSSVINMLVEIATYREKTRLYKLDIIYGENKIPIHIHIESFDNEKLQNDNLNMTNLFIREQLIQQLNDIIQNTIYDLQ